MRSSAYWAPPPSHTAPRLRYPAQPLGHVRPGSPVSPMDTRLAAARARSKSADNKQLRTLLLFFAFWLFAAGFFLIIYVSRLA